MTDDPPQSLESLLRSASRAFRMGMEAQGTLRLKQFLDRTLAGAEGGAIRSDATVMPLLQEILGAQMRGDHLRIADLLEYELLPRL